MVERRLKKIDGVEDVRPPDRPGGTRRARRRRQHVARSSPASIPTAAAAARRSSPTSAQAMADVPGIVTSVEQPLAHLISAMLSGVQAQVAIKLYGDDLDVLRTQARGDEGRHRRRARREGPVVEPQVDDPPTAHRNRPPPTPAVRPDAGTTSTSFVETAMHGKVVSEILLRSDGRSTCWCGSTSRIARTSTPSRRLSIDLPERRNDAARLGGRDLSKRAGRTPSTASRSDGGSCCSATSPAGGWSTWSAKSSSGWNRSKNRCPPATSSSTAASSRASSRPSRMIAAAAR